MQAATCSVSACLSMYSPASVLISAERGACGSVGKPRVQGDTLDDELAYHGAKGLPGLLLGRRLAIGLRHVFLGVLRDVLDV